MSIARLRRLRMTTQIRELFSQTQVRAKDLIMPYFVREGRNKKEPILSLPGIHRLSIDNLINDIEKTRALGIRAILLFGICDKKNDSASGAYREDGIVQKAIVAIKERVKDIVIITDVCLCAYASHGHCGIMETQSAKHKAQNYIIDNDETLKILTKVALSHARSGADFVAPSAMMDGQVKAIREVLDNNSFKDKGILAYSVKYASGFYGPFREALDSSPRYGDRKSYQMDYRNSREALREIKQDIEEGADIIMVKPALAYLDIISRAKDKFHIPLAAYNVSGEYALIKGAAEKGIFDEREIVLEVLGSIKRAGVDLIISYHAQEAAKWLRG